MIELFQRVRGIRLARYIVASVIALGADMATFLVLLSLGVFAAGASAAGYCLGILVHWLVSSRKVFGDTLAASGPARTKQKALFVISALMGLGLTTLIVGAADFGGIDPRLGKLVAIAASFALTWVLRNRIVFRGAAAA
ncbi:MAG: GtrA family protein [Porphyrobacter sp.]|nr:GtrA family protein [Porphyrobacter sp.]